MFLLSRKIKALGVKMVLSGEGSDEIFGGYLYFHAAPDKAAFHQEPFEESITALGGLFESQPSRPQHGVLSGSCAILGQAVP